MDLFRVSLDYIIVNYARCFSNIFFGTTVVKWTGLGSEYAEGIADAKYRWDNIYLSRTIADNLLARYPNVYFNWYISYEANLGFFIGDDVRVNRNEGVPISGYTVKEAYRAFLIQLSSDLYAKRPRAILWSPSFWTPFAKLTATQQSQLQEAVRHVMSTAPRVNWLHFQDMMGQRSFVECLSDHSCFQRISYKDWEGYAFNCENTASYYNLLRSATASTSVVSLRTNMEMFSNRRYPNLDPQTKAAEPFKYQIIPADRGELVEREACYAAKGVPIGASWEIRWWYRSYFAEPPPPPTWSY